VTYRGDRHRVAPGSLAVARRIQDLRYCRNRQKGGCRLKNVVDDADKTERVVGRPPGLPDKFNSPGQAAARVAVGRAVDLVRSSCRTRLRHGLGAGAPVANSSCQKHSIAPVAGTTRQWQESIGRPVRRSTVTRGLACRLSLQGGLIDSRRCAPARAPPSLRRSACLANFASIAHLLSACRWLAGERKAYRSVPIDLVHAANRAGSRSECIGGPHRLARRKRDDIPSATAHFAVVPADKPSPCIDFAPLFLYIIPGWV
jgi:hypothetical protein